MALATFEEATTNASGTVLRYGALYGPGTYYAPDGAFTKMIANRQLPILGDGGGVFGFLHVDDAASATVAALSAVPGTYSIVDDTPVPASEWIEAAAVCLGAKPPRRLPAWVARGPLAALRHMIDGQPAVSNAQAKEHLDWTPTHANWNPSLLDSMTSSKL